MKTELSKEEIEKLKAEKANKVLNNETVTKWL